MVFMSCFTIFHMSIFLHTQNCQGTRQRHGATGGVRHLVALGGGGLLRRRRGALQRTGGACDTGPFRKEKVLKDQKPKDTKR